MVLPLEIGGSTTLSVTGNCLEHPGDAFTVRSTTGDSESIRSEAGDIAVRHERSDPKATILNRTATPRIWTLLNWGASLLAPKLGQGGITMNPVGYCCQLGSDTPLVSVGFCCHHRIFRLPVGAVYFLEVSNVATGTVKWFNQRLWIHSA